MRSEARIDVQVGAVDDDQLAVGLGGSGGYVSGRLELGFGPTREFSARHRGFSGVLCRWDHTARGRWGPVDSRAKMVYPCRERRPSRPSGVAPGVPRGASAVRKGGRMSAPTKTWQTVLVERT